MSQDFEDFLHWRIIDGVGVFEVVARELIHPQVAQELSKKLRGLLAIRFSKRMILVFRHTKFMSSSAFSAIIEFAKAAALADVQIALCELTPEVKIGADILQLGRFIPIFDDEASALASFASPPAQ